MQARKKPVVIDCFKYEGNPIDVLFWWKDFSDGLTESPFVSVRDLLFVKTLEGDMFCEIGCIIIRGVKGEYYPCRADIFEATYDIV